MTAWANTGSIRGPQGVPGPTGPAAPQGTSGTGINLKGSVPTFSALPTANRQQGDAYFVQDENDNLYSWNASGNAWVNAGPISGPAGPAGPTGAAGPQGIQGPIGATGGAGAQGVRGTGQITGDLYLDQSNGDVYKLNVAASGIPVASLPAIGAAYEGGYYGGLISQSMNGVATHALIIAPSGGSAASGQGRQLAVALDPAGYGAGRGERWNVA